jgi:hypothetical protein
VVGSVLSTQVPTTVPTTIPTTIPPTTGGPVTVAPATAPAAAGATVPPMSTAPPPSTAAPEPAVTDRRTDGGADAADDGGGWAGWSIGLGLGGVVVVLAVAGAWIAVWSLLRTRGSADAPARSVRARLRADRIAASRAHHPAWVADPVAPPTPAGADPNRPNGSSASVPRS